MVIIRSYDGHDVVVVKFVVRMQKFDWTKSMTYVLFSVSVFVMRQGRFCPCFNKIKKRFLFCFCFCRPQGYASAVITKEYEQNSHKQLDDE